MAVDDVERVVDVEGDAIRRKAVALQPQVEQNPTEADDGPEVGQVPQTRARRLRAQILTAVGQAPAGELEGRLVAKAVEVVGVLIGAGDGEGASAQDVDQTVSDTGLVVSVADGRRQLLASFRPSLAMARSMTTPSKVMRPQLNAAVIFLARTAGEENGCRVSSVTASVARVMLSDWPK